MNRICNLLRTQSFIFLVFLFSTSYTTFSQVIVNEVLYDPAGTDTGLEFVELFNTSANPVVLTGYELKLAESDYFLFPSFTLNASMRVVVHNNLEGVNTQTDLYTGSLSNMGNTQGSIALFSGTHSASNIVDFMQYGAGGQQWESAAVGAMIWTADDYASDSPEGSSLNLDPDGADENEGNDWQICEPSSGADNCSAVPPTDTPTVPSVTPTIPASPTSTSPSVTPTSTVASPTPPPTVTSPTPTVTAPPTATSVPPTYTSPPATSTVPPPTNTPSIDRSIVINEVFYDPVGSDTGLEWVELYNSALIPRNLLNYELKADDAAYYTFPDIILAAGGRVIVHINAEGLNTENELYAGLSANMGNTSGSVVLFNGPVHSVSTIVDFIQYGAGAQTWESTAVNAGIWSAGDFVPDTEENLSLNVMPDGSVTDSSTGWQICYPSFLMPNCSVEPPTATPTQAGSPTVTPTTGPGTPTVTPEMTVTPTPGVHIGVVINEVLSDPDGTDTGLEFVELFNNSSSGIDLTGYDLRPDDAAYYTIPDFQLAAGATVVIHVNATGDNTSTDLYTGPSANMGNATGYIALFNSNTHSSSTIIDYMEYGSGGQTWESAAVAAGIWTAGDFASAAEEARSMNLCPNGQDFNAGWNWYSDASSPGFSNNCSTPPPTPTQTFTSGPSPTPTITPSPMPTVEPLIRMAGFGSTDYRIETGGYIQMVAWVTDPDDAIHSVTASFAGNELFELMDDGSRCDFGANDGIFGFEMNVPPVPGADVSQTGKRLLIQLIAEDEASHTSSVWPFFTAGSRSGFASDYSEELPWWIQEYSVKAKTTSSPDDPKILMAGYMDSRVPASGTGNFNLLAVTQGISQILDVELLYNGISTGVILRDDGLSGDLGPGDGVFGLSFEIYDQTIPPGEYFFGLEARDVEGRRSDLWPFLTLAD